MDIFAHWLWTYALYFKNKYRFLAAFFGILPDMLSFGPFFLYNMLSNGLRLGKPEISSIPEFVFVGYNFTHSLVIFLIIVGVIYFITRNIPIVLGGWLFHIIIDIPTHTRGFFPTPFLWPLSEFKISGISWADPIFLTVNYLLLFFIYVYLLLYVRKSKAA